MGTVTVSSKLAEISHLLPVLITSLFKIQRRQMYDLVREAQELQAGAGSQKSQQPPPEDLTDTQMT